MPLPRNAVLACLLGLLLVVPECWAAPDLPAAPAIAPTPAPAFAPGRVIVQWEPGADRGDRAAARAEAEVSFTANLGDPDFQLVEARAGQGAGAAVAALRADPAVAVAERDGYSVPTSLPDDPLLDQLWGLRNTGLGVGGFAGAVAGDDIDATTAWTRTVGNPATVVADIDSGYRFEHPDLADVAWDNPGELDNGLDDDGNGIVDDLHGADFIGADGEAPSVDGDPTDDDLLSGGHGVHTAGTIGAEGDNGIGITGVAQDVRLMPLRVCSRFAASSSSRCPTSSIVAAIDYAGAKGARAANISLTSTDFSQMTVNAIAANPDVLFVISAGNDGVDNDGGGSAPAGHHYPCDFQPLTDASPPVPGAIDNVVCVAATDQADALAAFSDWGATSVDLGAPGTQVLSTYPLRRLVDESFEADDFDSAWTASGAQGGFERTNEAPLTSFGMSDSPGAAPAAGSVRASTSAPVPLPPGFEPCALEQSRTVSLGGGVYRYEVLLDGSLVAAASPSTSGHFSLALEDDLAGGGEVSVRFRYTAGEAPGADDGVWLDDIELHCTEPVGQATGYAFLDGTSMAAPHVTGAAALLFSLEPAASVTEVRDALLAGVDPDPALAGKTTSGGRLDLPRAMDALEAGPVDVEAPDPPLLTATDPASPASEGEPKVLGSAEAGSTVDVYQGPACEGSPLASGSAAELEAPGIAVAAAADMVTQFTATATDQADNTSECSQPISYTRVPPPDLEAPAAPELTETLPASPAEFGLPRILGTAEPGSAVALYSGASCEDTAVATGSAEELSASGLEVSVPAGATSQFTATATDQADNTSECSQPISYTNSTAIIVITEGEVITEPLRESPPGTVPAAIVPPPAIPTCRVPKLFGKTLGQTRAALGGAGCRLGKVTKPKPRRGRRQAALVVRSSSPAAGSLSSGPVGLTLGPKPKKPRH